MAKTGEYVGRLRKTLYRTREAPQLWHKELRRALGTIGFQSSRPHPRVFNHWRKDVYIGAQVDDLLVAGPPSDLEWVQGDTKKTCEIKGEMLKHGGMVKFLGREIRLTQGGVACASDPKHAQLLIDEPGLRVANGTDVPLGPEDPPETDPTKEPMSVNEAKFYRRCAAKLNYMALDRPDLCVAANMLSHRRVTRSPPNALVDICENTRHVSVNTHSKLFLVPCLYAQTAIGPVAGRRGAVRVAWQCFWVKISCVLPFSKERGAFVWRSRIGSSSRWSGRRFESSETHVRILFTLGFT